VKPGGRADHPIELLSASLDRELQPSEESALEAHLEGCAACRGLLGDFGRLDQAMASEPLAGVPADLRQRILDRLPPRTVIPAKPWWRQAMPLAAAASLVMAVLLWYGRPDRLPPLSESTASKPDGSPLPQPELPPAADRPSPTAADSIIAGNEARSRLAPPPAVEEGKASAPSESFGFASPTRSQAARRPSPAPAPAAPSAQAAPSNWKVEKDSEKAKGNAPAAESDGDVAANLRSLGYIGNPEDSKKHRQPVAASPADASEARRDIERKELAETQARTARDDAARRVAAPAAQAAPGPFGLFATPYRIRLEAERRMSVVAGPFSCVVAIDDVDVKTISAALQESVRALDASNPVAQGPDGTIVVPATPAARDVVLRLVRERYRSVLESRCGPLPE